ncbi:unnamed protein product, partial [Ectocarpus fasciculatus]
KGGCVGFVRASSLSNTGSDAAATARGGSGASSRTTNADSNALAASTTTASAAAASAATARKVGARGSTPRTTTSSWGSLGRGAAGGGGRQQRFLQSSNGRSPRGSTKVITLPLHVVGLQFRQSKSNDAWSSPQKPSAATAASSPPPHGEQPAAPAACANDDIGSNTVLELEREPYNIHDRNAIKVLLPATPQTPPPPLLQGSQPSTPSRFLGYIPGRIAVLLAPVLDASAASVARVTLKTVEEEGGESAGGGARNTLPALLEVHPLDGAGREPFSGLMEKLRDAAKKEDKRQQKRRSEAKANKDRLRSKQKTLLLDFGRSSGATTSKSGGSSSTSTSGSARGGTMLESMPWEVLWQIFCSPGISSRELFGPIRGVCGNWMRAVDAMPCAAARREVAKVCAGEPTEAGHGGREHEDEKGGEGDEPSEASPSGGKFRGRSGGGGGGERDGGGDDEDGAAVSAMATGDDDGGGGQAEQGNVSGCGKRLRRMRRHLDAVKVLCEEWGLLGAGGASAAASSGGGASSGSRSPLGSWSGWEAFGLAIATSASRDRLSLCCWAVRPLMGEDTAADGSGGDDGSGGVQGRQRQAPSCPGLPRGEVIELLCLMLCALRSMEGGGGGDGPMAQADGSARLKADLLVCARVLENWDVRFQKPGHPGGGGGGGGGASGLISNLTAEQRSIVLADVKPGGVLTVLAFAGTGKTTCLRAYAQARPHLKILYLTVSSVRRPQGQYPAK